MEILFNLQVDCEATQHSINDAALGERAIRGLGEVMAQTGMKASFLVIPRDIRVHAAIYRELEKEGHEVGLHCHPADQGYEEFLGVYGFDDQVRILREGIDVFAQGMGRAPLAFTPGYASANDHTFPVLESLGLKHGLVSIPTRDLPRCAAVWGNSPLEPRYPHRWNRCLNGDVDFVDVPPTVDVESRMWGGAHPQDLRVELVDAKNHWYNIQKNVKRLVAGGEKIPVKHLKAITHNIFDYSDPKNFRRETLLGMIAAVKQICETEGVKLTAATTEDIAGAFRAAVPLPARGEKLELDARGRGTAKGK